MQALLTDMLPDLRFDATRPLAAQFGQAASQQADLALEIGFGGGEHLAGLAEANPAVNFIGAEPFVNGVASLLRHMQTRQLSNIRIWDDDVRLILPALPVAGVSQVFIMFPDPWPKKRHAARRILQPEMMDVLAQLIRPSGQLVLASDDPTAKGWLLQTAMSHPQFCWTARRPDDWRQRPPHLPATRYMAKAEQASRQPSWFIFERRG
jgi:tRNA (guanine-N7-)-methyltransferase